MQVLATREILTMGSEDVYGLWEVIWSLRGLLPDRTEEELRSIAQAEMRRLLASGLIYLCRYTATTDRDFRLDAAEAEAALERVDHWSPPASIEAEHLRFSATEAGERAYHAGELKLGRKR